ncbi:hypothetical protein ARSQ2_02267 [Arsenophonus endosymbiont of Bemisia tabaci Q2]|nr:hypothetical protein ARSQ2_02267 [Arsenophonus endosymbiont of Bemisia tabaci Q2]
MLNITKPAMRVFESSDEGKKSYISSDFLINLENGFETLKEISILMKFLEIVLFLMLNLKNLFKIIRATTGIGDLILDFHLGSGTTAASSP